MSIADFMFTPREQRVLSLVLSTPERTFNLAELMSRSGAGSGAGQHTVRRLWEAGVLRESRMGNQRLFQANTDFPLYPELRSICAKSFGLAGMLREALAPLVDEIDEAFVFGSVARGTDTAGSDILYGAASSLTDVSPWRARRARMPRRVACDRAAKVESSGAPE